MSYEPQPMSATRKGLSPSAAKRLGFAVAKATAPAPVVFKKFQRVICGRHTTFQRSRQLHPPHARQPSRALVILPPWQIRFDAQSSDAEFCHDETERPRV